MFFKYQVTYYDEIAQKDLTKTGMVCGETYFEACERIINYYGEQYILEMHVYWIEDTDTGVWEDD